MHWKAYTGMGFLFEKMARFEEAVASYERALEIVKDGYPPLKRLLARARAAVAAAPLWVKDLARADEATRRGDYAGAGDLYEKGLAGARKVGAHEEPRFKSLLVSAHYNLACIYSLASIGKDGPKAELKPVATEEAAGLRTKALASLRKAFELGWTDLDHIRKDPNLAPLRDLPEFKALMKEWEEKLGKEKEDGKGK